MQRVWGAPSPTLCLCPKDHPLPICMSLWGGEPLHHPAPLSCLASSSAASPPREGFARHLSMAAAQTLPSSWASQEQAVPTTCPVSCCFSRCASCLHGAVLACASAHPEECKAVRQVCAPASAECTEGWLRWSGTQSGERKCQRMSRLFFACASVPSGLPSCLSASESARKPEGLGSSVELWLLFTPAAPLTTVAVQDCSGGRLRAAFLLFLKWLPPLSLPHPHTIVALGKKCIDTVCNGKHNKNKEEKQSMFV